MIIFIFKVGGVLQCIDKRLVDKIELLVEAGVKTTDEMKRHLKQYVTWELFPGKIKPSPSNRRYYPTDVDIRNHMYRASMKRVWSKVDQKNLDKKIEGWKKDYPQDSFFFRPCAEDGGTAQDLLFAHQTEWQKRLLVYYGNEITLLDATYKTMRYELPLFFLVVKTNVNYIVVGSFVIQHETTKSIEEALNIFKKWNPKWSPRFFMTDFCHEEINAIERIFPGMLNNTVHLSHQSPST